MDIQFSHRFSLVEPTSGIYEQAQGRLFLIKALGNFDSEYFWLSSGSDVQSAVKSWQDNISPGWKLTEIFADVDAIIIAAGVKIPGCTDLWEVELMDESQVYMVLAECAVDAIFALPGGVPPRRVKYMGKGHGMNFKRVLKL